MSVAVSPSQEKIAPQVATNDTLARELAREQAHVDRVYEQLEVATQSARQVERDGRDRHVSDRADYMREEYGTALFERDAFAFQAAKRLASLDAEHEGLVFGRLDLSDDDTRYIGRLGVRDDDYEPLVIDWRAPAAEPFYRATPANPLDVIRRRVLRTRGETVIGIEDDLLDADSDTNLPIIGEGALMAALTRARGTQMRDIVATIQAAQDEAIRAPYQGVTMITGGPGTGKTVVALHRAAYLLYSNRKRLERGGVLVVGPSAVFMNYIDRVLPSLGEDSVTLHSIGAVAVDVLGVVAERNDDAASATIKGSLRMLEVLRRLVLDPLPSPDAEKLTVTIKGDVYSLDAPRLARIRREVLASHQMNRGRQAAEHALLNHFWQRWGTDPELNSDEMTRDEFDDLLEGQMTWRRFMAAWWPTLSPQQALARLGDRETLDRVAGDLLSNAERDTLAASLRRTTERGRASSEIERAERYSVADIALLDELAAMMGPVPRDADAETELFLDHLVEGGDAQELVTMADRLRDERDEDADTDRIETFAHVLIDEAQDITPMQWRMLRRRGPQASWTLVGDLAQSSWPDVTEAAQAMNDLIGRAPHRSFELDTNYRSPAEVVELASKVISRAYPDADLPKAVRATGHDPELLEVPASDWIARADAEVERLSHEVEGTIGVIAPPSLLAQLTSLDLMPTSVRLGERVHIITPLQSKGLEYDAVIVVSPDDIVAETQGGERVLYVALTRPTQRLVTLDLTGEGRTIRWREGL